MDIIVIITLQQPSNSTNFNQIQLSLQNPKIFFNLKTPLSNGNIQLTCNAAKSGKRRLAEIVSCKKPVKI
ncbi:MAG: hypothetical protein ACSHXF_13695 [Aquaticitalea sp.]